MKKYLLFDLEGTLTSPDEGIMYEGIPKMMHKLQSKGMFLAVTSSKPQNDVERTLEQFGLRKYFKVVAGGDKALQEALNRLFDYKPIQKSQVYIVGDGSSDVEKAKAAGIESVGVTYGCGDMEELKAAKADYIVRSVEELEKFLMRGTEDDDKEESNGRVLGFRKIWVMLYSFLMFMAVRSIVMYVVDLVCVQLWNASLPAALDAFLFVRDPDVLNGDQFGFTGNQGVIKAALGFIGGAIVIRRDAMLLIQKTAEETRLNHLRKEGASSRLLLAGAVIGSVLGLNLLFELTGIASKSAGYQAVVEDQYSAAFLIGLIYLGFISPIAEELMFRGIIHNYMRRVIDPKLSMLISSALFGIYHMNYIQGVYGFIMGCLITYSYEYFGDFRTAVAVHVAANVIVYCLTYSPVITTVFVSWPVCIVFCIVAVVCLWKLNGRKNVF